MVSESRLGFDLERLRPLGTIMGCNALYRDFMPDALTGVDHGIMHEIYHKGVACKIPFVSLETGQKSTAFHYKMMVEGAISKMDLELVRNEKGVFTENERGHQRSLYFTVLN